MKQALDRPSIAWTPQLDRSKEMKLKEGVSFLNPLQLSLHFISCQLYLL
jgi:hypothetical protein